MKRIVTIFATLAVAAVVGCADSESGKDDAKTSDGISIEFPGGSVKVGEGGVDVRAPGVDVKVDDDKVDVRAPNTDVHIEKNKKVGVRTPGVQLDMDSGSGGE